MLLIRCNQREILINTKDNCVQNNAFFPAGGLGKLHPYFSASEHLFISLTFSFPFSRVFVLLKATFTRKKTEGKGVHYFSTKRLLIHGTLSIHFLEEEKEKRKTRRTQKKRWAWPKTSYVTNASVVWHARLPTN